MTIEFHPEALIEFREAATYYGGVDSELGNDFVGKVDRALDLMTSHPEAFPKIDGHVRRCLTRRFPYGVLFSVESDRIFIIAVMHCARRPGYWKHRLSSE
jgi:toxin ParE1/3/4